MYKMIQRNCHKHLVDRNKHRKIRKKRTMIYENLYLDNSFLFWHKNLLHMYSISKHIGKEP